MTTPEQSPGLDEDIWDTSSDHGHDVQLLGGQQDPLAAGEGDGDEDTLVVEHGPGQRILSDVPSLRRQHMTAGYREGLSVGKARVMQAGFDHGYPFGVEIGMRVGTVLGVLEGLVAAVSSSSMKTPKKHERVHKEEGGGAVAETRPKTTGTTSASTTTATSTALGIDPGESEPIDDPDKDTAFLRALLERAQRELKIAEMMKALDDETVARLEAPIPTAATGGAGAPSQNLQLPLPLPREIEEVVARWERIVLGALRGRERGQGES